ncbi:MAG TPA: regulatory protein RecX, partial [Ruminococcaceae bacterium]|nr:regulatory protein RecX [Oscillospiraceae bacterium]
AEQNERDAQEGIRSVLQKRYRNLSDEKIRRRAAAALQRLGYEYDDIRAAMRLYSINEDEQDD